MPREAIVLEIESSCLVNARIRFVEGPATPIDGK